MKVMFVGGLTESRESVDFAEQYSILQSAGHSLGEQFASRGHELILCSPFSDSLDHHVVGGASKLSAAKIEFHYPNIPMVTEELKKLLPDAGDIRITRRPSSAVESSESAINEQYSWLFAQLKALESCAGVVALGGKPSGAASLLFQLAVAKNKSILPLTFMGGAAVDYYDNYHWDLYDVLGKNLEYVTSIEDIDKAPSLMEALIEGVPSRTEHRFFISYARDRPQEADFVETLIRRRNGVVYRDEEDFEPAEDTQEEILKNIKRSNVFVAIWCKEYACSPWCFDELELAIERKKEGFLELWIFCVDDTRMVPKNARTLNYYPTNDRESIEAKVLHLMSRLDNSES